MELDELKDIWKSGQVHTIKIDLDADRDSLLQKLETHRKRILRANILGTVAMSGTISFLSWMLFHYKDMPPLFYISIVLIILLSGFAISMLWFRHIKKTAQFGLDSRTFINSQLKRLIRGRKMIEFSPFYGFVLGVLVNAYCYSLIEHASVYFAFWMVNINWIYIILVMFISYKIKMRRYTKNVEPLVRELQTLSEALEDSKD